MAQHNFRKIFRIVQRICLCEKLHLFNVKLETESCHVLRKTVSTFHSPTPWLACIRSKVAYLHHRSRWWQKLPKVKLPGGQGCVKVVQELGSLLDPPVLLLLLPQRHGSATFLVLSKRCHFLQSHRSRFATLQARNDWCFIGAWIKAWIMLYKNKDKQEKVHAHIHSQLYILNVHAWQRNGVTCWNQQLCKCPEKN